MSPLPLDLVLRVANVDALEGLLGGPEQRRPQHVVHLDAPGLVEHLEGALLVGNEAGQRLRRPEEEDAPKSDLPGVS